MNMKPNRHTDDFSQAEYKKETHKQLVQSALLTFTAFIAICAVGMAWFINNSAVSGGAAQVQSMDTPFELAMKYATHGKFPVQGISEGTVVTYNGIEYAQTDGRNSLVSWMVDSNNNFQNASDEPSFLQPGSFGSLTFYVIPTNEKIEKLEFTISLTPYEILENAQPVPEDAITILPKPDTKIVAAAVSPEKSGFLYQLLQGHVLFFEQRTGDNQTGYRYAKWVNETFVRDFSGAQIGQPQEVTLYWIWPLRFDNYVATGNGDGNLFSSVQSDDFNRMLADMNGKESYKRYFYDATDQLKEANVAEISSMGEEKDAYRGYYNAGDEEIGTKADYVQLVLTAMEHVGTEKDAG